MTSAASVFVTELTLRRDRGDGTAGEDALSVHHRNPSPILMAYPGATIYLFGDEAPRQVEYSETEHYQVTRAFLANPERMLRELIDGEVFARAATEGRAIIFTVDA